MDYNKYKKLDQNKAKKRNKVRLDREFQQVNRTIVINLARTNFYHQLNNIEQICHNRVWGKNGT